MNINLIKPSYEIMSSVSIDMLSSIEKYGRTCYKSEDKISDGSASEFVKNIISRGHETVIEHEKITVKFICDRGISHEIVRHRLASFSQESTRYVNYKDKGMTFIIPFWCENIQEGNYLYLDRFDDSVYFYSGERLWFRHMHDVSILYTELIDSGWVPQKARSVLPNSLKTEIVVTANLREWRHVFKLRTASAAHPQIVELMKPLQADLHKILPEIFEGE